MYGLLLVCIVILLLVLGRRERFSLFGFPIISFYPNTCGPTTEKSGLLCYPRCRYGYEGDGPFCRLESVSMGAPTPVELEPCPKGWDNHGLTCYEPVSFSWSGGFSGGNVVGRLNNGGICPDDRVKINGLCYKKCTKRWPHRMGFPAYDRCSKVKGAWFYGRGVGTVPPVFKILGRYGF
jgi:hypothetical protein